MVRGNPAENVRSVFQEIELLSHLEGLGNRHLLKFLGAHEDRAAAASVHRPADGDDALAAGRPMPKITIVTEYCAGGQVRWLLLQITAFVGRNARDAHQCSCRSRPHYPSCRCLSASVTLASTAKGQHR